MSDDRTSPERDANTLIATGLGIGVIGAVGAAIGGAVCPVCVVAAPALLGIGAYKRWRAAQRPKPEGESPPITRAAK